jgi:hypothetical protein
MILNMFAAQRFLQEAVRILEDTHRHSMTPLMRGPEPVLALNVQPDGTSIQTGVAELAAGFIAVGADPPVTAGKRNIRNK